MADSGYFQFMQRLKIQDKKKVPLEKERLDDAIWVFVRNLAMGLLFSPLLVYITKLRFVRTVMFRFFWRFFSILQPHETDLEGTFITTKFRR